MQVNLCCVAQNEQFVSREHTVGVTGLAWSGNYTKTLSCKTKCSKHLRHEKEKSFSQVGEASTQFQACGRTRLSYREN